MSNIGSYILNINDPSTISKILNAKVNDRFDKIFKIANLEWKIQFYPNGTSENNGSCVMYIKLVNMPTKWKSITLRQTIQCIQTSSSSTWIFAYKNNIDAVPGWKPKYLLSKLQRSNPKQITFKISFQIHQIVAYKNKEVIFNDIIPIKPQQTMQWKINKNMINKFKQSHNGEIFESPINNNSMFMIKCYPQGLDERYKGKMSLYLQLIHLGSPKIHRIKIKYTLSCPESGGKIKFSETKKFCKDDDIWGNAAFCTLDKLLNGKNKKNTLNDKLLDHDNIDIITLKADIHILSVYDKNGDKIPNNKWNYNDDRYDYDECTLINGQQTTDGNDDQKCEPVTNDGSDELIKMGFDEKKSIKAWKLYDGDIDNAVQYLLENELEELGNIKYSNKNKIMSLIGKMTNNMSD